MGYVPKVKSYVRDTQDFISKILEEPPLPPRTILVTMDIVSLPIHQYPEPWGSSSNSTLLEKGPHQKEIGPFILKLIELCLHNTNFQFNGEHYLQIGGTSMGNPFAPSEANLFLGHLEEKNL
jgi:hypothetical protein